MVEMVCAWAIAFSLIRRAFSELEAISATVELISSVAPATEVRLALAFSIEEETASVVAELAEYERVLRFLQRFQPSLIRRVKLYSKETPLFEQFGLQEEINKALRSKVWLKSGGSIVINQTEALVAIDVNSGSFRADNNNAEETAYRMNLQAAKEIARQLRLRDLGGVIVNDFIDMREERHRRGVERAVREAIKRDRARTKVLRMSAFGLIEMTRQRIRPSLKRSVYEDCHHCTGAGVVKTAESMAIDVMRLLALATHRDEIRRIAISVHPSVAAYLSNRKRKEIARFESECNMTIQIGIVEDYERIFATHLALYLFVRLHRLHRDMVASGNGAGKADCIDIRRLQQRLPEDPPAAHDEIEYALGQARINEDAA